MQARRKKYSFTPSKKEVGTFHYPTSKSYFPILTIHLLYIYLMLLMYNYYYLIFSLLRADFFLLFSVLSRVAVKTWHSVNMRNKRGERKERITNSKRSI